MELYQEIDRKRAERHARRMERKAREERKERILTWVGYAVFGVLLYAFAYFGSIWAAA